MKATRSARGELVDFDVLAIRQQLAASPIPVGVNERRKFIDEKDGIRAKTATKVQQPSAFSLAQDGIRESEAASLLEKNADITPAEEIDAQE